MPRLSQTPRFLQRPAFRQAQSALIGQLTTSRIGNVTALTIIMSLSFQNESKGS